eukprot:1160178-Rhodomonas_salina.1
MRCSTTAFCASILCTRQVGETVNAGHTRLLRQVTAYCRLSPFSSSSTSRATSRTLELCRTHGCCQPDAATARIQLCAVPFCRRRWCTRAQEEALQNGRCSNLTAREEALVRLLQTALEILDLLFPLPQRLLASPQLPPQHH